MATITLNPKLIKALIPFTAIKDPRYYLQGVCIEYSPTVTRCIATDGHIMGMAQETQLNEGGGTLIIPLDACKRIAATRHYTALPFNHKSPALCTSPVDPSLGFVPVDGKFPDYQRIFAPAWEPQEEYPAYFDPALLYRLHQCAKAQGLNKASNLTYGAKSCPARFQTGDVYGIVMPWRSEETPTIPADYLNPLVADKSVAIAA